MQILSQAQMGVRGMVMDKEGRAIPGSALEVDGIAHRTKVTSNGEYWRLLTPGTYLITAMAPG
jgi:carboxypeptidase Z